MRHHRMRPPHAKNMVLALCGLAAAAGMAGAAASPDAASPTAPGPVAACGFDGTGPRVADPSDNANDGATTAPRVEANWPRPTRPIGRRTGASDAP